MSRPKEITKKLKMADPDISGYIVALEKQNLRLHKRIHKLSAENTDVKNELKAKGGKL